jgi:endonuclease/exonuclease/phosphatase family metal-dependent hydrolase
LLALFVGLVSAAAGAPVRVATYNILNFPQALGGTRLDDFRAVMAFIAPDILIVQEMQSHDGAQLFLDSVMKYVDPSFTSAPFNDGPDTDNALFYRSDRVTYLAAQYLATPSRDIAEYRILLSECYSELYLFSVHFKASEGITNETIRLQEATILRNRLNTLPAGRNFIVAGDFNIYYSGEPAYQKLIDSLENASGRLIDPLDMPGYWHDNSAFAVTHTQSTRVEQLPDGGAGGGLDDRFDMILCSATVLDGSGLYMVDGSYRICGNDGAHFNQSINYGYNAVVPAPVADALYWASDHLPVYIDLTSEPPSTIEEQVVKVWPNPMQNSAEVVMPRHDDFVKAKVCMTNILGQRVYDREIHDPVGFRIERGDLAIGVYFLHVTIETRYRDHVYLTRVAVVK